ncbi:hypothetical protein [Avibacterium paragallinarum]|uniref:hypothetical protein n=1 Tax=Avibacterium paragallinarum TaxID=728 RepID=UPI00397E3693
MFYGIGDKNNVENYLICHVSLFLHFGKMGSFLFIFQKEGYLNEFLLRICGLDENKVIYDLVWKNFSQSIRLLADNKFIFQPFWDYHNGKISETEYLNAEIKEREKLFSALENQNIDRILDVLFRRLYTLRNQIIHGGATFNSSVNREQLKTGCNILSLFLPVMLEIMMKNHNEMDWGKPFYPVVKDY